MAEQAEATGAIPALTHTRALQLHILVLQGEPPQSPETADQLAAMARGTGVPEHAIVGFAAAAQLLHAQHRAEQARELLVELEQIPEVRGDPYYGAHLPELVRCALALPDPVLAARLTEDTHPRTPLFEHSICSARVALDEATDRHTEAAEGYAQAARLWQEFGNVPEQAHALLGQGRCLTALGDPQADQPLREARALFHQMGARPRISECDTLIARTSKLSS